MKEFLDLEYDANNENNYIKNQLDQLLNNGSDSLQYLRLNKNESIISNPYRNWFDSLDNIFQQKEPYLLSINHLPDFQFYNHKKDQITNLPSLESQQCDFNNFQEHFLPDSQNILGFECNQPIHQLKSSDQNQQFIDFSSEIDFGNFDQKNEGDLHSTHEVLNYECKEENIKTNTENMIKCKKLDKQKSVQKKHISICQMYQNSKIKPKITKTKRYWDKQTLSIPNVFRLIKSVLNNKEQVFEYQDLSHKEVLIQQSGMKDKEEIFDTQNQKESKFYNNSFFK